MAELKIGNRTYRCDKMPATEGVRMAFRLSKAFAPIIKDLGDVHSLSNISERDALKALSEFLMNIDADDGTDLVVKLAESAEILSPQGAPEPVVFDAHFSGNVVDAVKVAVWVARVNFGDFFTDKRPGTSEGLPGLSQPTD